MCGQNTVVRKVSDKVDELTPGFVRQQHDKVHDKIDAKAAAKDAAATAAANEPARLAAERIKAEADALNSAAILGTTTRRRRAQQSLMASGAAGNDQNVSASSVMAIGKGAFGS